MAMDVIQKIADQIAFHRAELLRLESALEVIAEMGDKSAAKVAERPMITVRKTIDHQEVAQPPRRKSKTATPKKPVNMTAAKPVLLQLLKAHGPMKSGELTRLSGFDAKMVWNSMYSLKSSGKVDRLDDGRYQLPNASPVAHVVPETPPSVDNLTVVDEHDEAEEKENAVA